MAPLDRKAITEELEMLQLEETRDRVVEMRNRRAAAIRRIEQRDRDIQEVENQKKATQAACWHKKGGKGVAMLFQGNDANYAVIKHTLSHGPTIVVCQRCSRIWEPPPAHLNARNASKEDKAIYRQLYAEYQQAMNFPTDNEPSGTQLFVITREETAA